MTLREIAKVLQSQGVNLNYRQRKDGSIVITRIDGVSYRNKSGNAKARALLGETLSSARIEQLQRIRTPKGKFGHKKAEALDKELKKELRKVQREFRKRGVKEGKPTTRNLRWAIKHHGREEAVRRLKQANRYARGIAYPENVIALALRLEADAKKLDGHASDLLTQTAEYLRAHSEDDTITEDMIKDALEALYEMEKGGADSGYVTTWAMNVYLSIVK